MSELVKLGYFDYLFFNLFSIYFYEGRLDVKMLRESLDKTIKLIPILSSEIVYKGKYCHFKPVQPSNVKIIEKEVDEDLHSYYLPDENGLLSYEEGIRFKDLCETIQTNPNNRIPKLGVPLMVINLLHNTKKNKSVLCVSMNHSLGDSHSITYFMDAWSKQDERLVKKFNFSRKMFQKTEGFDCYKTKRKIMDNLRCLHPQNQITKGEEGFMMVPKDESVSKLIHFSKENLENLKKMVRKFDNNKRIISSNDCISGYMWKLWTITTGRTVKSGVIPFKIIVNFRSRYDKIDESFFGNAVTIPNRDATYEEIMCFSYEETVVKVRELVNLVKEDLIQSTIDCVQDAMDRDLLEKEFYGFARKTAVTMNDWRIMDLLKPHFNNKCERVYVAQNGGIRCPSCFTVVGSQMTNEGLDVIAHFEKKVYEKIKNYDLSSLEDLEKIKKIEF